MRGDKTCPCFKCLDRTVGCHGKCERYTSWSANRQQERQKIQQIKEFERAQDEYIAQAAKRMSRGRQEIESEAAI